jgi:HAD superfamily hydrolase (TIGR01509 family)
VILLFDAMSTIVHEPFVKEVPAFFEMPLEELVPQLSYDAWVEFEKGAIDEGEFQRRFFKDGRSWDYDGLVAMLRRTYRYVDGMEALLAELAAANTPMHILSNYPSWYQIIEDRLAVTRFLPWTFVSCDTGVRKPDRDAYLGAARTLGTSPERCLFIDDRRDNVTAARAVGMQAIEFRGTDDLRAQLQLAQHAAGTE